MNMYAIRDAKSERYNDPVVCENDAVAQRAFIGSMLVKDSVVATNPEDFAIFRLGTWDDESGGMQLEAFPVMVMTGVDAERVARAKVELAANQAEALLASQADGGEKL